MELNFRETKEEHPKVNEFGNLPDKPEDKPRDYMNVDRMFQDTLQKLRGDDPFEQSQTSLAPHLPQQQQNLGSPIKNKGKRGSESLMVGGQSPLKLA